MLVTLPEFKYALAVAPVPPPPSKVITGTVTYPLPEFASSILSTTKVLFSAQCLLGYAVVSVLCISLSKTIALGTSILPVTSLYVGVKSKSLTTLCVLSTF